MIKINLLTAERKVAKKRMVLAFGTGQKLIVAASLVLVLCGLFIGWRYWTITRDSARLDADIVAAQKEVVRLQPLLLQVKTFEERKTQVQQRVALIEQLRTDQKGPVHMLDQISRALPPMLWLTDLKQTAVPNEVVIGGRCTTLTGISDFVVNLEASGYFKKSVEIISTTAEVVDKRPGELIKFELKALFQQPGDAARAAEAAKAAAAAAAATAPKLAPSAKRGN
jgi:Tfp pilus assembly protein PilN